MHLLADCGNSAIKVAELHGGHLGDVHRVAIDPGELSEAMVGVHLVTVVASGSQALETLRQVLPGHAELRVLGLQLPVPDVNQYETMGHDRICAGLAAWQLYHQPLIIVDAGTATTVTAWLPAPNRPASVRTPGGLILPGAAACARALSGAAPHLPVVETAPEGCSALQRSTAGALGAALGIGYPAMVERCVAQAQTETGAEKIVVTGGMGQRWLPQEDFHPHLVLDGLRIIVGASDAASS